MLVAGDHEKDTSESRTRACPALALAVQCSGYKHGSGVTVPGSLWMRHKEDL